MQTLGILLTTLISRCSLIIRVLHAWSRHHRGLNEQNIEAPSLLEPLTKDVPSKWRGYISWCCDGWVLREGNKKMIRWILFFRLCQNFYYHIKSSGPLGTLHQNRLIEAFWSIFTQDPWIDPKTGDEIRHPYFYLTRVYARKVEIFRDMGVGGDFIIYILLWIFDVKICSTISNIK